MSIAAPPTAAATRAPVPICAPAPPGGLGSLVPVARAAEDVRLVLRKRAAGHDPRPGSPTVTILARHAGPTGEAVARHVSGWWGGAADDEPLVCDEGCDVRVGRTRVGDPTRQALLTWLPPAPQELAVLEAGLLADDPVVAVQILVRPPTIWSWAEAVGLRSRLPEGPFDAGRFTALEQDARPLVAPCHLLRLCAALLRLETAVSFSGRPRATATVTAGCAALRGDEERAVEVAATQLARFACSRAVERASADGVSARASGSACLDLGPLGVEALAAR
jgi:hypothetical protein